MYPTHDFILDSLKSEPIGDTDNFLWFISDIGIVALLKKNQIFNINNLNVEKEANSINLDITKEEKEYCEIGNKKLFIFYS